MKAWHFYAVVYNDCIYCVDCLPEGITAESDGVFPIFANSEWDYYPVCDVCLREHDYVCLTDFGREHLGEPA